MQRKNKIAVLVLGALAVLVGFGATVYRTVSAAATTVSQSAEVQVSQAGRGPGGKVSDTDLAAALNIPVDQLTAAREKAQAAALKQAVDQGLMTQTQADDLAAGSGALPFGGRWESYLSQKGIDPNALLADALGITVDQLSAAQTAAQTAARSSRTGTGGADGQMTQEQTDLMQAEQTLRANESFQSAMQTAFEAAVKDAVSSGVITQAQADLILANQTGSAFGAGMHGLDGMRGGHHGGPGGAAPDSSSTDNSQGVQ
jgi:hypothetical protein